MNQLYNKLCQNLEKDINRLLPHHPMGEIYKYALLPPGKLFRPLLVASLAMDVDGELSDNHQLLASFVEMHHAYTLIHDDLPCMDNDDFRRGKPSTHKEFGEWQALLAGDGLLNGSYQQLARINAPRFMQLLRFATWALGSKGLIFGQHLDLETQNKINSFKQIAKIHVLKTSRLIQTSIVGSYLLCNKDIEYRKFIDLFKLGHNMGLAFQLLDDLSELIEAEVEINNLNQHETEINPFLHYKDEAISQLERSISSTLEILKKYQLANLQKMIDAYYLKNIESLKKNENKFKMLKINIENIVSIFKKVSAK